jgi:alkylhydroperoxidase family enzyme
VAHIAEVEERRLYAREASPSMFAYCTEVLHLSEAEAYLRIATARASREHPVLLEMLADGRLHLSGAGKLVPHLNKDNAGVLLARAAHKTKRQILELIAEISPRPDARTVVRKLPERRSPTTPGGVPLLPHGRAPASPRVEGLEPTAPGPQLRLDRVPTAQSESPPVGAGTGTELRPDAVACLRHGLPPVVEPLAPGRYRFQFTGSTTLKSKLERLQALMRSQMSGADLAAVIEAAVTEKLERLETKRFAQTSAPRKALEQTRTAPTSRHVPAAVRRAVVERDSHRCRFLDAKGRRCSERNLLEFHHVYPFGRGGGHNPANVSLLCKTHNLLMAEQDYGRQTLERNRGSGAVRRQPGVGTHTNRAP